jgi:hypothetical protein
MGAIMTEITLAELAEQSAGNYDTFYRKAKRKFPETDWNKNSVLSADHIRVLSGKTSAVRPAPRKKEIIRTPAQHTVNQPAPVVDATVTPARAKEKRDWMLYGLMVTATAASVQNMYRVTAELTEANMSAWLLTAVLSVSAIVFVLSGVRRWWTGLLAALLIAYESMCNMTRIHAGLYTESGNSTRFLGQFCDTFDSGTHESAFFLAAFTAFFIAAVQYAAVFELNKK